jgi:hypothetical protein
MDQPNAENITNASSAPAADATGVTPSAPPQEIVAAENQPDPRANSMSAILANRNRVIEKELNIVLGDGERITDDEPAHAAGTVPEPQASGSLSEPAAATPAPEPAAPSAAGKEKLVVYGKEVELTPDEIRAYAQQGMAATQTWQEAKRLRDEAQIIYGRIQQPQAAAPAPQSQTQPQSPAVDPQVARNFAERLNYGSEEEQVQAVQDLVASVVKSAPQGQAQSFTPEQIVGAAVEQAMSQIQHQQDLNAVASEFSDVFQDNMLSHMAGQYTQVLRQHYAATGVHKSNLELYRESLGQMRSKYLKTADPAAAPSGQQPPSVQAAQQDPMKGKLERKRAAPQPVAAASKIASEAATQKAPNASDVVARMRASRGQQSYK